MKTLLLVDDESRMLDLLGLYLTPFYRCIKVKTGKEAIEKIMKNNDIDLLLLDIMMPELDGWEICEKIRTISAVPIIMLSARDEKVDIIKGLRIGADDYITKPFDEEELLARIEAVFRRYQDKETNRIVFKGLVWDKDSFEITFEKNKIPTTPKEFFLVGLFLQNPNKVFSREHLLHIVWGTHTYTEDRTIDSHIRNVRDKLRHANFPVDEYLKTIWGIGYKWIIIS